MANNNNNKKLDDQNISFYTEDLRPRLSDETPLRAPMKFVRRGDGKEAPPLKFNDTITIYGKRGTGKSFCARWLIDAYKDVYPWYWVFTKTKFNSFYSSFLNPNYIIEGWDTGKLAKIYERQKTAVSMWERDPKSINPLATVIFDDVINPDLQYDRMLADWYNTGRHAMVRTIALSQHLKGFPPVVRKNTDLSILFRLINVDDRRSAYENFGSGMKFQDFEYLLDKYTENRGFLAMHNDPDEPIDRRFYYGKAEEIDPTRCYGCVEYWDDNMQHRRKIKDGFFAGMDERKKELVTKPWSTMSIMPIKQETREIRDRWGR